MKSLSKQSIILIVLGAIAVLAVGVLVVQKSQKMSEKPQNTVEIPKNQGEDNKNAPETVDTSDWQTYRNEEYGYELRYPVQWTIRSEDKRKVSLNSTENERYFEEVQKGNGGAYSHDITIRYFDSVADIVSSVTPFKTMDEMIEDRGTIKLIRKEVFAGEDSWFVLKFGYGTYYSIYVQHSGHIYEIFFGKDILDPKTTSFEDSLSEEEKEILNSFSFL